MVTGNSDRSPVGELTAGVFDNVSSELNACCGRESVSTAAEVFLQTVVLNEEGDVVGVDAVLFAESNEPAHHDNAVSVSSSTDLTNLLEGNAVEQSFDILEGVKSNANLTNFAVRKGIGGVETHLSGEVQCDGEAGAALLDQVTITLISLFCSCKACILTHGPEAVTVHIFTDTAGKGVLSGFAELFSSVEALNIFRSVYALELVTRTSYKFLFAHLSNHLINIFINLVFACPLCGAA